MKPDAILTADLHLTDKTPVCRTDDYLAAQRKKLGYLRSFQIDYNCPVLDAGDVLDYWKAPPLLLWHAITELPCSFYTIPGNHDLPEHSVSQYHKSALAVLNEIDERLNEIDDIKVLINDFSYKGISTIHGIPYGQYEHGLGSCALEKPTASNARKILLIHEMVWKDDPPWPGAEGYSAKEVLKNNPGWDLIVSGHHHASFTEEYEGRLLVNPGSMLRMSANQIDHKPRFYLYYADNNTVEPVYYPIEEDVIDRSHLDEADEKKERVQAYIERMDWGWDAGLSFRDNLEEHFKQNKTPKKVRELIWEQIEE